MHRSSGSRMPAGATRDELNEKARQLEHLRVIRELQSERRVARWNERSATLSGILERLQARVGGRLVHHPAAPNPDHCAACPA